MMIKKKKKKKNVQIIVIIEELVQMENVNVLEDILVNHAKLLQNQYVKIIVTIKEHVELEINVHVIQDMKDNIVKKKQ